MQSSIHLEEGDIIEDARVDEGNFFRVKKVLPPHKNPTEFTDDKPSNCFRPFAGRGGIVTNDMIDALRNQDGDQVTSFCRLQK